METKCYVYAILDSSGVPFYIGKGMGLRYKATLYDKRNSPIKKNKINKIIKQTGQAPKVKILCYGSSDFCLSIEKKLIKNYGRIDKKSGILVNTTDGGTGGLGIIKSKETRKKISKAFRGKNHWNFGKKASLEHKEKLSKAHVGLQSGTNHPLYGKPVKLKSIQKRIKTIESKRTYTIFDPSNNVFTCRNLKKFCIENNLSAGTMSSVAMVKENTINIGGFIKFMFDLDDTLVAGDVIADVCSKMMRDGLIDKLYTNLDVKNYDLRDLPPSLSKGVKRAFADPDYVWIKRPISGSYYFLRFLSETGHEIGIITARPASTTEETIRFLVARYHHITFRLGIHVINNNNQIDMTDIPTKRAKLEEIKPDFYFDDNADYCIQGNDLGIETFLISNKQTPWNHEFAKELKITNHPITVLRNVAFFPETRLK